MNILLLSASAFGDKGAVIDEPSQLRHLHEVLAVKVGDTLKIAQKSGYLGQGVVSQLSDSRCVLTDVVLDIPPPPKLDLTVVLALPRPKVLRRLVLDMTSMGVCRIVLMNSYRTDKSYWGSPLLTKIDDYVYEGLQQGVDSVPPAITFAKRFKPFVQDDLPCLAGQMVVAHPYAGTNFGQYQATQGLPQCVIVGAEGGFIPYEIELLQSVGVVPVSLGQRILRTESAVSALVGRWLL